jgi:predicted nucleotidyltransferase
MIEYRWSPFSIVHRGATVSKDEIIEQLIHHQSELKRHSVKKIFLFGSYARGEGREESDLDFIVAFEPDAEVGLFAFARLRRRLNELLGREVDLVTPEAIRPEMREEIWREAVRAA